VRAAADVMDGRDDVPDGRTDGRTDDVADGWADGRTADDVADVPRIGKMGFSDFGISALFCRKKK
tara:strand:- start:81 stop:275 length:195 start_codon:yes stop_codon:yes gene_type:complete